MNVNLYKYVPDQDLLNLRLMWKNFPQQNIQDHLLSMSPFPFYSDIDLPYRYFAYFKGNYTEINRPRKSKGELQSDYLTSYIDLTLDIKKESFRARWKLSTSIQYFISEQTLVCDFVGLSTSKTIIFVHSIITLLFTVTIFIFYNSGTVLPFVIIANLSFIVISLN